jgi:phage terminase large subunit
MLQQESDDHLQKFLARAKLSIARTERATFEAPEPIADRKHWPPDYQAVLAWREQELGELQDQTYFERQRAFYSKNPVAFICHWADTYDPRKIATGQLPWMPMVLFQRQADLITFFDACLYGEANGLVEKARDMGATWCGVWYSIWLWLFVPGASIGWGSQTQVKVDRIGEMDSIFEKIRQGIRRLQANNCPFLPTGLNPKEHLLYLRILNPYNGNTITGEIGDNIGRGGRKLIYFKDESAHYEHAEMIESALLATTRVQIDMSSVHGVGTVFHRKRDNGRDWSVGDEPVKNQTNVFVLDYFDSLEHTQEQYNQLEAKYTSEGMGHLFAQEVQRDYSSAMQGTIIEAKWIRAALDAHVKLQWDRPTGAKVCGLDVADEGGDTNAQAIRQSYLLSFLDEWGERDTARTARRAVQNMSERLIKDAKSPPSLLVYDATGVGAGVKGETNRLKDEKLLPPGLRVTAWIAAAKPLKPEDRVVKGDRESPKNEDFFANAKAQGWWELRKRFERTYRWVEEGIKSDPDDCISLPKELPMVQKLMKELSQPQAAQNSQMKMLIDKQPEGTKSPNLADACMMAYHPMIRSFDYTYSWV